VFLSLIRTPEAERDLTALSADAKAVTALWRMLNEHLQDRSFLENDNFTLADIELGAYAKRWFGLEGIERPSMPYLERWYSRLETHPGFKKYVDLPLT